MASDSRRRGSQITSSYIASDKRLDGIPERLNSDSAKRPDTVVFDEKIVFSDTNPAGQMTSLFDDSTSQARIVNP